MYVPERFARFALPSHLVLLTRDEAARRAACTVATIDRWISSGQLPHVKLSTRTLVRMSALDALLGTRRTPPVTPTAPDDLAPDLAGALATRSETAHWLRSGLTTLDRWSSPDAAPPLALPCVVDGPRTKGRPVRFLVADVAAMIDANSVPATAGPLAGRHA